LKNSPEKEKGIVLVNFRLNRKVVEVLDRLVESGLYKTRVDIVLSALRVYEPFQEIWKKEVGDAAESSIEKI